MNKTKLAIKHIPTSQVTPNPEQPRIVFDVDEIQGLANSIKETGQLTPISVESTEDPKVFILEDGERRWRACKLLGIEVTAVVKPPAKETGQDRLLAAATSNIQRADLNPIEEAKAYKELIAIYGNALTVANKIGVNGTRIRHRIKLLELEEEIQDLIAQGKLVKDLRAVSAILNIPSQEARIKFANSVSHNRTTVPNIVVAANRITAALSDPPKPKKDIVPSIAFSELKVGDISPPIWDQLARTGKLPTWDNVKIAGKNTCKACAFSNYPSEEICNECPAVILISAMIDTSRILNE